MNTEARKRLLELAARHPDYSPEAYWLVIAALNRTVELVRKGVIKPNDAGERTAPGGGFHVSGRELLEGFRFHVREQYGGMGLFLLHRWGLRRTEDVGRIVFALVESGELKRRETDTPDDFANGYVFEEAFRTGTIPE